MADKVINTIHLQTYSWITKTLGIQDSISHTFEKKVEAGTSLSAIFSDMAREYPEFGKAVFNSDTGILSDQVVLIINQRLARFDQVKATPLNDKDEISLVPIFIGG